MSGRRLVLRIKLLLVLLAAGLLAGVPFAVVLQLHGRGANGPLGGTVVAGIAGLLLLVFLLLDRQLVLPLARIDQALDRVGESPLGGPPLLTEGDLLGRVAPSVARLERRLAEERARIAEQISALERTNAQLRAAREGLARSERLASVGRLASGVAHELGNPVSAILGYCAILEERLRGGRDLSDYASRIAREAARMDRILRDLLDLARPREATGPLDLAGSIARAVSVVEGQGPWSACSLRCFIEDSLPRAVGDEHYVVQVFVNLLTNAAKAGARTVEVRARALDGAPVVEVLDDGKGLPPDYASRLFEPFFTTAPEGEGTGLGLAVCHATMERFGGTIAARPREPGPGAVFTLRFAPFRPPSGAPA